MLFVKWEGRETEAKEDDSKKSVDLF
jgi:hypothetical protein